MKNLNKYEDKSMMPLSEEQRLLVEKEAYKNFKSLTKSSSAPPSLKSTNGKKRLRGILR